MASRRAGAASSISAGNPPAWNALLISAAFAASLWFLTSAGRVTWQPREILTGLQIIAGCLAVVGPLVLLRQDMSNAGIGDLLWLTGGLMVWVFDLAAIATGHWDWHSWATPVSPRFFGLALVAVAVAGWRTRSGTPVWTWTNVAGWLLGAFWILHAIADLFSLAA